MRSTEGLVTLKFAWEKPYREALLEFSSEALHHRIQVATEAIEQRAEQLRQAEPSSGEEHRAIDDAKRALRVLARTECQAGQATGPVLARNEVAS